MIHQGRYYLSWLVDHRDEFQRLVRDRLGAKAAARVLWSSPRLICVAGDYTRYDVQRQREHRRSIHLVRYRLYGDGHIGLETVASIHGHAVGVRRRTGSRVSGPAHSGPGTAGAAMSHLAGALDEVLLGLGGDVA